MRHYLGVLSWWSKRRERCKLLIEQDHEYRRAIAAAANDRARRRPQLDEDESEGR